MQLQRWKHREQPPQPLCITSLWHVADDPEKARGRPQQGDTECASGGRKTRLTGCAPLGEDEIMSERRALMVKSVQDLRQQQDGGAGLNFRHSKHPDTEGIGARKPVCLVHYSTLDFGNRNVISGSLPKSGGAEQTRGG